jgi:hypothetical protein
MDGEAILRALMFVAFIALMGIRFYFQSKVLHDKREVEFREGAASITAGAIAALAAVAFSAEYLFFPGAFPFAYWLHYPE